eukprot:CAMPEP_0201660112 /NCGR_PEP_ID=MMETSP0494-20130426/2800_1 /ASSEMBLY_ACC=CAM_ASM_000839 /TAXON_ID=420259 /ORGANISM="Thalassiosira gravida, Strain GMp14c1" /LENGTH=452 /DNA_ID=CAMNT_0048137843 /DNA_START=91 /DNA_END=1449 /DNA_ORIENTATION=+
MTTTPFSLLLSLPDEHLPNVLSYLTLKDALHMRLVCAQLREIIFESTHHLWMDVDSEEEESTSFDGRDTTSMSARQMRHLLATFSKLRSLRLFGLELTYQSLVQGRNGAAANPRYICNLLQEAECAQHLECLELLAVSSSHTVSGEWGAAAPPSYSMHTDMELEQLRKLTVEGYFTHREHPLVHSLLRASHQITHLNITGCIHFNDYDLEEAIMKPLVGTLTHLNLSESLIQHPTIHSTILETLTLQRCVGLYALDPESFCPSLDALDVSSCPLFNGEGMLDVESGLANICPRLRTLNLSNCRELTFIRIKTLIPKKSEFNAGDAGQKVSAAPSLDISDSMVSSRLEYIDLSKCVNLSNASISCPLKIINLRECFQLKVLSISAPDLEVLDLSCLPLMLVSLYCRSLVHLNLAKCRELDSKHSIIKCESLKSVDLRGATYMTLEFFNNQSRK